MGDRLLQNSFAQRGHTMDGCRADFPVALMKQGNFVGSAQLDLNSGTELQHTHKPHKWPDRDHGQACMTHDGAGVVWV
jgi:hypothetical protein